MIEIAGLSLTYPKSRNTPATLALDNINLTFEDETFSVIVGPSGCGKTTLLHCIAGLLKYDGNISFDGTEGKNIPIQERELALVNQNYVLYPHLTIFDNIAFPLKTKGAKKKEVVEAVYEVAEPLGLMHLLTRKPKELSGGQQQRVALARALVKKPRIFLFDEPLSNVSPEKREEERQMIRFAVRRYQAMAIYVTHNLKEATSLADNLIVMDEGKVVISGKAEEVIHSGNPIVESLLEAGDVL